MGKVVEILLTLLAQSVVQLLIAPPTTPHLGAVGTGAARRAATPPRRRQPARRRPGSRPVRLKP